MQIKRGANDNLESHQNHEHNGLYSNQSNAVSSCYIKQGWLPVFLKSRLDIIKMCHLFETQNSKTKLNLNFFKPL